MKEFETICLLNDSFPPQYDGVAMATLHYANELGAAGYDPLVVAPSNPKAYDDLPFPVLRYPSVPFNKMEGYVAGIPFSPEVTAKVRDKQPSLLHSHCPIISTLLARELRQIVDAPIVLTYHTKFDIDIANLTSNERLRESCKKVLAENISACDEVWAVSRGAGENLRTIGYEGDYIVMPNGSDMPLGRVSQEAVMEATEPYALPEGVPVYLFVGRMMWYKGIRLILDALARLKHQGRDFRMVFIGSGNDRADIEAYAAACGTGGKCVFTGPILDRETLRAWYSRADLFLFPSSYDTNGLVVREAAAAGLPSVLIEGSCAAESVTDRRNGFLIEENPESLFLCLDGLYEKKDLMRSVGAAAQRELYISWKDAVATAAERYGVVLERYRRKGCAAKRRRQESILRANGELMEALGSLYRFHQSRKRRSA